MVNQQEPIAIIGIGCRFPGDINTPESFWQALAAGRDILGESENDTGRSPLPRGGFLSNLDAFDYTYFGIAPREASRLDPQQRLLLEVTAEALDDAGLPREQVQGSNTGVFVGVWGSDFEAALFSETNGPSLYGTTGSGRYAASGRISFFLDIYGPSLTIDTACSSSLVAVHLACQSMWQGECKLALAGGANVILQPQVSNAYGASGMLSPEARCKFGDESANGYVRSEGAAVVALKPLALAQADNDPIYAVINGSVVSHDGKRGLHFVSPGIPSQEALLRQALGAANVEDNALTYVEAHGTGTSAGDYCELNALHNVLGSQTVRQTPLPVGSVKSNFGHMEAAAGVAGLIKVALMLSKQQIPSSLHVKTLNPRVPWDESHLFIPQETLAWEKPAGPRLAGITSFGITGTNAHAILSDPPAAVATAVDEQAAYLIPISAHSLPALKAMALELAAAVANADASLADWAYTLGVRRSQLRYRGLCFVDSLAGFVNALKHVAERSNEAEQDRLVIDAEGVPNTVRTVAAQFLAGEMIDWASLTATARTLRLPTYPWQRRAIWFNDQPVRHRLTNVQAGAAAIGAKLPQLAHAPEATVWNLLLNGKHPLQTWPNPDLVAHVEATLRFDKVDTGRLQLKLTQPIKQKLGNGLGQLWINDNTQGNGTFHLYTRASHKDAWQLSGQGSFATIAKIDNDAVEAMRFKLTQATESQLVSLVPQTVSELVADALSAKQLEQLNNELPFKDVDLNSHQAHTLCRHLQLLVADTVTPTIFNSYPTLGQLTNHISSTYFLTRVQAAGAAEPEAETAQEKYGDLSTDALAAKLAARLGQRSNRASKRRR